MSERWARGIVFAALVLLAPWPWYLFAVGGLLPIPVILMMAAGFDEALFAAVLATCASLGVAAFWFLARALRHFNRRARPWAVAGSVGLLLFLAQLPLYGGGENLASPAGKFRDAASAYAVQIDTTRCRFTTPRDTRRC